MKKSFSFFVFLLVLSVSVTATEVTDLGGGLSYLRVHAVSDSASVLPKVLSGPQSLVLDLRYAVAGDDSAAALQSALAGRKAPAETLLILVSPATPPALATIVAQTAALTLGTPDATPAPKVVIQTDAATDRRAYDALDAGTPLDRLISGKIDKVRYDEATLVEDFDNGTRDPEPPPDPDPTAAKPDDDAKDAPLVDRVLQRAVQLHQALLALRRPGR